MHKSLWSMFIVSCVAFFLMFPLPITSIFCTLLMIFPNAPEFVFLIPLLKDNPIITLTDSDQMIEENMLTSTSSDFIILKETLCSTLNCTPNVV